MHFQPQKAVLPKFLRIHFKRLLRALVLLAVIVIGFLGFWFVLRVTLNTEYPILPVSTADMCTVQPLSDCWKHPFAPTLHIGDLLIVQGIDANSVNFQYPNSDIIVFHAPKQDFYGEERLIITRVVDKWEENGIIYFRTKSDGSGSDRWPEMPEASKCDYWNDCRGKNYTLNGMISDKLLVSKVVLRIPWLGHLALFMFNSPLIFIIVVLMIIILIVEFAIPTFTSKKAKTRPTKSVENALET